MNVRWPAEWEEQDGVLMAWPHAGTDWAPDLERVTPAFAALAAAIARRERLLVLAPDPAPVRAALARAGADPARAEIRAVPCNDTWARDFGPLAVYEDGAPVLRDFRFNGWGGKFDAALDDRVTAALHAAGAFAPAARLRPAPAVLEGGSVDGDGAGTVLATAACLLAPTRNPGLGRAGVEALLRRELGARRVLWLEHGWLAGDDTDSHVDMLARFAPGGTILHMRCDDPRDEHHAALAAMAAELAAFRTAAGAPYRLVPLPWPRARFDAAGRRLPVSYANFLVLNGAVLVPVYGDPADAAALAAVGGAFPGRAIAGLDASALIVQHGALHCLTMQLPKGTLA